MFKIILFALLVIIDGLLIGHYFVLQGWAMLAVSATGCFCSAMVSIETWLEHKEINKMIAEVKQDTFKNLNK